MANCECCGKKISMGYSRNFYDHIDERDYVFTICTDCDAKIDAGEYAELANISNGKFNEYVSYKIADNSMSNIERNNKYTRSDIAQIADDVHTIKNIIVYVFVCSAISSLITLIILIISFFRK